MDEAGGEDKDELQRALVEDGYQQGAGCAVRPCHERPFGAVSQLVDAAVRESGVEAWARAREAGHRGREGRDDSPMSTGNGSRRPRSRQRGR